MMEPEELDAPQDAPLRVHLWWQFWRRWKVILGLAGVAALVWTNPSRAVIWASTGIPTRYQPFVEQGPASFTNCLVFTWASSRNGARNWLGILGMVFELDDD